MARLVGELKGTMDGGDYVDQVRAGAEYHDVALPWLNTGTTDEVLLPGTLKVLDDGSVQFTTKYRGEELHMGPGPRSAEDIRKAGGLVVWFLSDHNSPNYPRSNDPAVGTKWLYRVITSAAE